MTDAPNFRILALVAENFKKLKAVSIRPDGALVQVSGKNRQGKSSTLDAIWAALGGGRALPTEPIRHGEERARIHLEIGDDKPEIIVTRTFIAQEDGTFTTALKVENGEGAKFSKPQEILDALVGSLSFDPLAFTRMKDEDRLELLRPLAPGIDFAAEVAANAEDYSARTVANRKAKDARAIAADIQVPAGAVPQPVDVSALQAEYEGAAQFNSTLEARRARRDASKREIDTLHTEEAELREKLDALIARRESLEEAFASAEALPEPKDLLAMRERLNNAAAINAHAGAADRRAKLEAEALEAETQSAALTKAIDAREAKMASAVAAAVKDVPGLEFAGETVRLNGAPFDQASDAEQLEAAILIGGLLNPRLRVIRIRDGSLLDSEAMEALAATAERMDLQCWVERVSDDGSVGFVLENGELKGPGTSPSPRAAPAAEPEETV